LPKKNIKPYPNGEALFPDGKSDQKTEVRLTIFEEEP